MKFLLRSAYVASFMLVLSACSTATSGNAAIAQKLAGCPAGQAAGTSPAGLNQTTLCIISKNKVRRYTIEIASTEAQQEQGLMYRNDLADDAGMIFPFPDNRYASFWMKNTVIPLDIIFIRADGKIENIAENAVPYSLDPIYSTAKVASVLELRGGLTGELGIKAGDEVYWQK